MSLLILTIFFFSFNISSLDFIWHAFHVPNDLPYRYSFIYVFVLISLGYYSILRIKDVNIFVISISFAIIFVLVLLANKLDFENINDTKTIICLALLIIYYLIIVLYKMNEKRRLHMFYLAWLLCLKLYTEYVSIGILIMILKLYE